MFAEFFISRPVFATVCSIIIVIAGAVCIPALPISQYPSLAPPQVQVTSTYIGASAEQVESSVTTALEKEINGVQGLKYIQSTSGNDGTSKITATFDLERGIDQAAVDVQTKVATAQGRLPEDVKRLGVSINKVSTSIVLALAVYADGVNYTPEFISNYIDLYVKDPLKSISGVGDVNIVGERKYAMRIWLDPNKLSEYLMSPLDVVNALQAQNKQVGAGDLGGAPAPTGQRYQYNIKVYGRMSNPQEFANIVVKRSGDGTLIHVRDIGRVELGAENYVTNSVYKGKDAIALVIYLRSGGNALQVAKEARAVLAKLAENYPPGLKVDVCLDTTEAVSESIEEVKHTLFEAILLVILVIFVFLQDWRSMIIACVTIPVSLIGTFAFMQLFGFSINTLTLFGLTLATGLVVDDAIVVVENVKRHMEESKLSAFEATKVAMRETAGALVATALVLVAVFVPVAFFPGTTGQLYKQFALTIAISVALSAFNALTLSPALAALLLKGEEHPNAIFTKINQAIDWLRRTYESSLAFVLKVEPLVILLMIGAVGLTCWLFKILPTGFVPYEDQGYFFTLIRAPEGSSLEYTTDVVKKVAKLEDSVPEANSSLGLSGFGFSGNAANLGMVFSNLKHWKHREGPEHSLDAIIQRLRKPLSEITEASCVPFNPPALEGLGNFGGFVYELQDLTGKSITDLANTAKQLTLAGNKTKGLEGLFTTFSASTPQLQLKVKRDLAEVLNVDTSSVLDTLQVLSGSSYVNDFDYLNRSYRVYVQADKQFRANPQSIFEYYVHSRDGQMISLRNLLDFEPALTASTINHYNLFRSVEINGNPAAGYSSGQAIEFMDKLSKDVLPKNMTFSWSGISLEEISAGSSAVFIFILGLVFVFLVLSAQYESYTDPAIILLSVPPAMLGALLFQWLRGLENDVFCQIGLVMLVGLASKNAILIVEFANHLLEKEKLSFKEAALKAAGLRLRPILMTSLAFIVGLLPLVLANGAGANARQSLGTAVCGGMLVSTFITLYLVPVVFSLMKSFLAKFKKGDVQ
ncbi:MAG: efflux RND transporter permease subunit [Candidatus Obscuribacterales bacterium]|nr:efflux RND transporter permease subunit [Candidatus Obscuribacterales bacterium]